jgi:hypothetical protein
MLLKVLNILKQYKIQWNTRTKWNDRKLCKYMANIKCNTGLCSSIYKKSLLNMRMALRESYYNRLLIMLPRKPMLMHPILFTNEE